MCFILNFTKSCQNEQHLWDLIQPTWKPSTPGRGLELKKIYHGPALRLKLLLLVSQNKIHAKSNFIWYENINLALPLARTTPQGYGDLLATWCLRSWSTLAFGDWRSLVGNQTADKKKPNQPLPIHQLPLPWLQLWFVAHLQRYHGCGEEPQPVQSLPVSALGASGTHCHSSAFCHLCVLSNPGTCSGCQVLKCRRNLATATPACSTALAHHLPVPWSGTHNVPMLPSQAVPQHHCLAWLQPWIFQAWRSYPHTNLTSNPGDFITLLGGSRACKVPSFIFSPEKPFDFEGSQSPQPTRWFLRAVRMGHIIKSYRLFS